MVNHGKEVFADNCARCHSSKLPVPAQGLDPGGCSGPDYMNCWNRYWAWTKTEGFKTQMRAIVKAPDFLDGNYLSAEHRVPVTLLGTNACSPLATNGIRDNIWDNFTSETYKQLPSVGTITVYNPVTGAPQQFKMPDGGRGYTRPPSLISLWSTAPFLLNNSVGKFNSSPSVDARMDSFQDSIEKMLWPEKRDKDPVLEKAFLASHNPDFPGLIDRTTTTSYLIVPPGYVPDVLKGLAGWGEKLYPRFFPKGGIEIGPIPKGTPVGLLVNLNPLADDADLFGRLNHDAELADLLITIKRDLIALGDNPSDEDAARVFSNLVDRLMKLSKCPDYVVNRGHYFGTSYFREEPGLSDADKRALIEFLKTF
jgi:hypothetical protein